MSSIEEDGVRFLRQQRGVQLLVALLVAVLLATAVAALTDAGKPDVTGRPGNSIVTAALPGESFDTSGSIVNDSGHAITIVSVSVIPVPGFATPALAHLGLAVRPSEGVGAALGWPPGHSQLGSSLVRAALGASVPRGVTYFVSGLVGAGPGAYAAGGLRFTYRVAARLGHVTSGDGTLQCVSTSGAAAGCPTSTTERFSAALARG